MSQPGKSVLAEHSSTSPSQSSSMRLPQSRSSARHSAGPDVSIVITISTASVLESMSAGVASTALVPWSNLFSKTTGSQEHRIHWWRSRPTAARCITKSSYRHLAVSRTTVFQSEISLSSEENECLPPHASLNMDRVTPGASSWTRKPSDVMSITAKSVTTRLTQPTPVSGSVQRSTSFETP